MKIKKIEQNYSWIKLLQMITKCNWLKQNTFFRHVLPTESKGKCSHSFRRSIPAFLATASSPFFSMVFNAFVDKRSLTKRFPVSHQIFLYCKLTNCNFFVLWFEKETLLALFAFFPVKGQTLPEKPYWICELDRYISSR